ncbi:MAG: hypothetical protein A2145_05370, partial [candidate division Zixibacteria bacterium RBG_16_40_9]
MVGWIFNLPTLKSVLPGLVSMKANTAFGFILSGFSLFFLCLKKSNRLTSCIAQTLAGIVVLIGFLILCEYFLNQDLGIDQLLFKEPQGAVGTFAPGRMAPTTALNFLLLGLALLILKSWRSIWIFQFLTLSAGIIGLLNFMGYLYGVKSLYGVASYTQMALHTAIAFICLSVALLLARPEQGLMALITDRTTGGLIVRRLLPAAFGVPFLIGWLRLQGQKAGFYGTEFGLVLFTIVTVIVLNLIIFWNASLLSKADSKRKKAEEENRNFFTLSLDMLCIAGFDGYFKKLNPSWEKTLGFTMEDLCAKPFIEFVHPEDREKTIAEAQKLSTGIDVISFENRYLCKDGSYKWILWNSASSLKEELIYASARNITERKQAEEKFRLVVESAPCGMLMINEQGKILLVNSRTEKLFGYQREELIGQPVELLVPEHLRGKHFENRKTFFTQPSTRLMGVGRDLYGICKNGEKIPVEVGLSPVQSGREVLVLATIVDISERKQAEENLKRLNEDLKYHATQLEAANKELEAFSYSVSHDLRAPLRAIDGFSLAIMEDYAEKLDEEGKRNLERIRTGTKRMAQLIDDMLNLSRLARAEMRPEKVNLTALAQEIISELKNTEPDRKVEALISDNLFAHCDLRLIKAVMENLLNNAWKYTSKHPQAKIELGSLNQNGKPVFYV